MEEGLNDENQWVNIQDPIKQMITSITKAVRTQSAGIRDLDRKIGFFFFLFIVLFVLSINDLNFFFLLFLY